MPDPCDFCSAADCDFDEHDRSCINWENPNLRLFINDTTGSLDLTNDDGNSLRDLLPEFLITNILGYTDDALGLLDAHDEQTIAAIDNALGLIEEAAILLHRLDPTRHSIWLNAISTIAENSRDLANDD